MSRSSGHAGPGQTDGQQNYSDDDEEVTHLDPSSKMSSGSRRSHNPSLPSAGPRKTNLSSSSSPQTSAAQKVSSSTNALLALQYYSDQKKNSEEFKGSSDRRPGDDSNANLPRYSSLGFGVNSMDWFKGNTDMIAYPVNYQNNKKKAVESERNTGTSKSVTATAASSKSTRQTQADQQKSQLYVASSAASTIAQSRASTGVTRNTSKMQSKTEQSGKSKRTGVSTTSGGHDLSIKSTTGQAITNAKSANASPTTTATQKQSTTTGGGEARKSQKTKSEATVSGSQSRKLDEQQNVEIKTKSGQGKLEKNMSTAASAVKMEELKEGEERGSASGSKEVSGSGKKMKNKEAVAASDTSGVTFEKNNDQLNVKTSINRRKTPHSKKRLNQETDGEHVISADEFDDEPPPAPPEFSDVVEGTFGNSKKQLVSVRTKNPSKKRWARGPTIEDDGINEKERQSLEWSDKETSKEEREESDRGSKSSHATAGDPQLEQANEGAVGDAGEESDQQPEESNEEEEDAAAAAGRSFPSSFPFERATITPRTPPESYQHRNSDESVIPPPLTPPPEEAEGVKQPSFGFSVGGWNDAKMVEAKMINCFETNWRSHRSCAGTNSRRARCPCVNFSPCSCPRCRVYHYCFNVLNRRTLKPDDMFIAISHYETNTAKFIGRQQAQIKHTPIPNNIFGTSGSSKNMENDRTGARNPPEAYQDTPKTTAEGQYPPSSGARPWAGVECPVEALNNPWKSEYSSQFIDFSYQKRRSSSSYPSHDAGYNNGKAGLGPNQAGTDARRGSGGYDQQSNKLRMGRASRQDPIPTFNQNEPPKSGEMGPPPETKQKKASEMNGMPPAYPTGNKPGGKDTKNPVGGDTESSGEDVLVMKTTTIRRKSYVDDSDEEEAPPRKTSSPKKIAPEASAKEKTLPQPPPHAAPSSTSPAQKNTVSSKKSTVTPLKSQPFVTKNENKVGPPPSNSSGKKGVPPPNAKANNPGGNTKKSNGSDTELSGEDVLVMKTTRIRKKSYVEVDSDEEKAPPPKTPTPTKKMAAVASAKEKMPPPSPPSSSPTPPPATPGQKNTVPSKKSTVAPLKSRPSVNENDSKVGPPAKQNSQKPKTPPSKSGKKDVPVPNAKGNKPGLVGGTKKTNGGDTDSSGEDVLVRKTTRIRKKSYAESDGEEAPPPEKPSTKTITPSPKKIAPAAKEKTPAPSGQSPQKKSSEEKGLSGSGSGSGSSDSMIMVEKRTQIIRKKIVDSDGETVSDEFLEPSTPPSTTDSTPPANSHNPDKI